MKAYLIQEFSNLDQTWHSVNFASSLKMCGKHPNLLG